MRLKQIQEEVGQHPTEGSHSHAELTNSYDERWQVFRSDSDTEGRKGQIEWEARLCYRDTPTSLSEPTAVRSKNPNSGERHQRAITRTPRKEQQAEADHETGEQSEGRTHRVEQLMGLEVDGPNRQPRDR